MGTREMSTGIHKAHFRNLQTKRETSQIEKNSLRRHWAMPRLSEVQRERAIGMLEAGQTRQAVARHFDCHISTIYRLQERVQDTGSTRDRPRSGRPRVTSQRQDRRIVRNHVISPFTTATETASQTPGTRNPRISYRTVIRRLAERGIRGYRPYVGVVLTPIRRQNRRRWARNHSQGAWQQGQWRRVVFSDESRFKLHRADGRLRVYRRRNQRYVRRNVVENDRFAGGSLMVWGAIRFGWKSQLLVIDGNLTAQRYIDEVLSQEITPRFNVNVNDIFMHDNARPHAARITQDYLQANNVQQLPWAPYSPDMNPIEHLWDHLDRRVRARNPGPSTLPELRQALIEEWNAYPQRKINRLVLSMPRRVRALTRSRGGHTRY